MTSSTLRISTMQPALTPQDLWRQMKSIDFAILDHLAYLSRLTASRSPSGAHYALPGRAWLAARCGVSTRTITRHTNRLKALGILAKFQRRPEHGRWQTNLYTLVGRAAWLIGRSMEKMRRPPYRATTVADKPPSEREDGPSATGRIALRALIDHLTTKLGGT